jgi:hypothetical protein
MAEGFKVGDVVKLKSGGPAYDCDLNTIYILSAVAPPGFDALGLRGRKRETG